MVFIYGAFHRVSFLYKNRFFSIFQPKRFEVPWVFDTLPRMGVTRLQAETCKPWVTNPFPVMAANEGFRLGS